MVFLNRTCAVELERYQVKIQSNQSWNQGFCFIKDILLGKSPVFTIGVRLVGSV